MLNSLKRLVLCLLALFLLAALPAAAESQTMLQLTFIGMYATSDGSYTAVNIAGAFEVYQNGSRIGTIESDASGSEPFALPASGNVQLFPVVDTIPDEIPVNQQGYTVSIVEGKTNFAPVVTYARAGLFRVHTESSAEFALISEEGQTVMRFSTDSKGDYALPVAIPAGQYTLRMEDASLAINKWRDKIINVRPYDGPDSVTAVDASYYYTPEITLKPATPTPVPTATPAPTEAPTFTAEPTGSLQVPLCTATATPTAVPTATPVPTSGTLVLQSSGDADARAAYSISAGGRVYAEGELIPGETAEISDLGPGDYIVTVNLPEGMLLTGLNGYPSLQRRAAQWLASVGVGRVITYQVELSRACAISGEIDGLQGVQVIITGSENYNLIADGAFAQTGLTPDTYTVTAVLPMGEYTGEGWSFVEAAGQILAVTRVELSGGREALLPAIHPVEPGSESDVIVSRTVRVAETGSQNAMDAQQDNYASLRVQVFVDGNNNGVLGKNEPLLAGAAVTLYIREGGVEAVVAAAVTDEEGTAVLHAPAGSYILRCEMPKDYAYAQKGSKALISHSQMEQSIDRVQEAAVTIRQGEENVFGIGAAEMSVLSGTVWLDVNSDGLWQAEEPGVEGIRITADGARNNLHYETTTDADGRFEIRQIRNGTYNVAYHLPDGYVFTYKANGPKQQRSIMTTEADRTGKDQIVFDKGEVVDEQNIGLVPEAVIEGVCFLDANYNGVFDEGEAVLPGVELELFRQSNNKRLRTVTSDENGVFRFGNIRSDTFKIKALLPKDTTYTVNIPGNPDANQFAPRDGRREQTVLNISVENGGSTRLLVGAISYGSVSGVIYFDDNFSGSWESGEKIAQGIIVTLLDAGGEAVKSAKTNKSGAYSFADLTPGEYRISVTARSGYAFTRTGEGSTVVNDGVERGLSDVFTVSLGEDVTGMNAGMILPAEVSGLVFADANDNGLYDAGEKGLRGTVVSLMREDGVADSAEVGADGAFRFAAVLPGTYYLRYELPENGVFSPRVEGGNQVVGEGSDGAGDWFEVGMGDVHTAPVCGGLHLGVIDGMVFADSDGSGNMDGSEGHMAGLLLTLTPSRDDLSERVVMTGADGSFSFADLRPDAYTLTVQCPEGYVLSQLPDVTLPLSHGVNVQSVTVEVGMGSAWTEQALGCVKPASYSGAAWLDENLNGIRDAEERPASGEHIAMIDQRSGSVVAEMTTADDGSFRADGLAPGLYTLAYQLAEDVHGASAGDSTFTEADGRLVMADIAIVEGADESGALLGLVRETTLQGRIWLDSDGTIGMVAGAEVKLLQQEEAVASVVTGEDGLYTFDGLMPGDYQISVSLPERHLALEPNDRRLVGGDLVSILANNDGSCGESGTITVRMAQHQLQLDVGAVKAGRLGDLCWLDLNGNGLQDYGEGGIPGVVIELVRNGETVSETISDQYGYYVFEGLYPGEYTLLVTAPAQVKPTVQRTDLPLIVSVLTESGESIIVPVKSDGVNYAADLGFVLVDENKFPAGYGEGQTQLWTKP